MAVEEQTTVYHSEENTIQDNARPTISNTPAAPISYTVRLTANQIVLLVWLSGMAVGFIYIAVLACMLSRKIRRRSAPASAHLQKLLDGVKKEIGIKTKIKLVCQYEYGSPALLFPRTILIPMDVLASMSDEQIKNCLRHECMHYKRFDHVMSLLLTLLNAVYWFNPFMWLASRVIRKDMETACDSAVVKRLCGADT
jgi:bla regulator protein BlaR1